MPTLDRSRRRLRPRPRRHREPLPPRLARRGRTPPWTRWRQADGPRALVTAATGKFFSNGLDLDWLSAHADQHAGTSSPSTRCSRGCWRLPVDHRGRAPGAHLRRRRDALPRPRLPGDARRPRLLVPARGRHQHPVHPGMSALIQARLAPQTAHEAMATARRYGGADAAGRRHRRPRRSTRTPCGPPPWRSPRPRRQGRRHPRHHQGPHVPPGPRRPARPDGAARQLTGRPGPRRTDAPARAVRAGASGSSRGGLPQVEAVELHDLVPGVDEVARRTSPWRRRPSRPRRCRAGSSSSRRPGRRRWRCAPRCRCGVDALVDALLVGRRCASRARGRAGCGRSPATATPGRSVKTPCCAPPVFAPSTRRPPTRTVISLAVSSSMYARSTSSVSGVELAARLQIQLRNPSARGSRHRKVSTSVCSWEASVRPGWNGTRHVHAGVRRGLLDRGARRRARSGRRARPACRVATRTRLDLLEHRQARRGRPRWPPSRSAAPAAAGAPLAPPRLSVLR